MKFRRLINIMAAEWSTAFVDNLPDSSFAYVAGGGSKDSDGKTTPRSLRKLPFKDSSGKVDPSHARNALARLSNTEGISASEKDSIRTKLQTAIGEDSTKAHDQVIFGADDVQVPTEIELLQSGSWDTPNHGSFNIGPEDINTYVENFNAGLRKGVPINVEHDDVGGAVGWIKTVFERAGSLWGVPDWTHAGETMLKDRAFKFISPEFSPNGYLDPETGAESNHVLLGAALTNKPLFKSLTPVVANEDGGTKLTSTSSNNIIYTNEGDTRVDLAAVRTKELADLSPEEKTFIAEHKADLTAEEQTKFELAATPAGEGAAAPAAAAPDDPTAAAPAAAAVIDDKNKTPEGASPVAAPVAAGDGTQNVSISASDLNELKAQAAKGLLAHEQLEYTKASDQVRAWSGDKTAAKFKVTANDRITKFFLSLEPEQRKTFETIVAEDMHGRMVVNASEAGSGDEGVVGKDAAAQNLIEKAGEIMANDQTIGYPTAVKMALAKNPELAQEYDSELNNARAGV